MCEKGVKIQIYHIPNAKEASKYPFPNNNVSPTRGQKMRKMGGLREIRGKFAQHANVLSRSDGIQLSEAPASPHFLQVIMRGSPRNYLGAWPY